MRDSRLMFGAGIVAVLLAGCAGSSRDPVIAPVTMDVGDLQGETMELEACRS